MVRPKDNVQWCLPVFWWFPGAENEDNVVATRFCLIASEKEEARRSGSHASLIALSWFRIFCDHCLGLEERTLRKLLFASELTSNLMMLVFKDFLFLKCTLWTLWFRSRSVLIFLSFGSRRSSEPLLHQTFSGKLGVWFLSVSHRFGCVDQEP